MQQTGELKHQYFQNTAALEDTYLICLTPDYCHLKISFDEL